MLKRRESYTDKHSYCFRPHAQKMANKVGNYIVWFNVVVAVGKDNKKVYKCDVFLLFFQDIMLQNQYKRVSHGKVPPRSIGNLLFVKTRPK